MTGRNRTKIVATLGPASRGDEGIESLLKAGVDVFRLNCAHTDHKRLRADVRAIRRVSRKMGLSAGVLVDLQGPKIRIGQLIGAEPIWLKRGERLVVSTEPGVIGGGRNDDGDMRVGSSYPGLAKDVSKGAKLLLDDGNIELRVEAVDGTEIRTKIVHGGLLKQYKGINVPGSEVSAASLSRDDLADLACAVSAGADFIAQSFVSSVADVRKLRKELRAAGSDALAIAKIERASAVKNLSEILDEADGIMVARGDLGVEIGPEGVPALQKKIIREAVARRKPVITATQMLESMVTNPRPTRAEASDVANAIYDGTSAVMLSAETASGKYPNGAVRIMDQIIRRTEADMFSQWEFQRRRRRSATVSSVTMATVRAAAYAAIEADAKLIAVFTESGATAQLLAAERVPTRVVAFTPFQTTVQRLALTWGVTALRCSRTRTSHEMTLEGGRILLERRFGKRGDRIVVVFGSSRMRGVTNIMTLRTLE